MYEAQYYSSTAITISGVDLTDEFHSGREIEYATITGSITTSGIWTEDVTNSGITTSGTLISGSFTQDIYEYKYGIIENSTYTDPYNTINMTPGSDATTSGYTIYVKYGPGKVGEDDTFPSTFDSGTIYKLGHLNEFVGTKLVDSTVSTDKISTNLTSFLDNYSFSDTCDADTWYLANGWYGTQSINGIITDVYRIDMDSAGQVYVSSSGSSGDEEPIATGDIYSAGSLTLKYGTTVSAGEYISVRCYVKAYTANKDIYVVGVRVVEAL